MVPHDHAKIFPNLCEQFFFFFHTIDVHIIQFVGIHIEGTTYKLLNYTVVVLADAEYV